MIKLKMNMEQGRINIWITFLNSEFMKFLLWSVWLWKNIIRGHFDEITPLVYEYAYLHALTRAMQI